MNCDKKSDRAIYLRTVLQDPDVGRFYSQEARIKMTEELERLEGEKIEGNSLWAGKQVAE